jgi:hypothetical protein
VAVCVLPGTELSFSEEVVCISTGPLGWYTKEINHKTAIFRQINKEKAFAHHDALEFPDGQVVLLTFLREGQRATVLQLPAEPKTAIESESRRRVAYAGWPFAPKVDTVAALADADITGRPRPAMRRGFFSSTRATPLTAPTIVVTRNGEVLPIPI